MRPIRLALPLFLVLGALAHPAPAQQSYPTPIPVPPIPAPAPPRVMVPPPPQGAEAYGAALDGERLIAAGRLDEALAHFRAVTQASPADLGTYVVQGIHLRLLAMNLIRAGRLDEADRELARIIARAPSPAPLAYADSVLRLNDLRLYIQAGRGDIAQVLELLGARQALAGSPAALCPAQAFFPEVVAPAHRDPRVAAKLIAMGCPPSIIDQLDTLAARPIGANPLDPGLPPRPSRPPK